MPAVDTRRPDPVDTPRPETPVTLTCFDAYCTAMGDMPGCTAGKSFQCGKNEQKCHKKKRNGKLKARLCVQGCSQQPGVDYDQTHCATMRGQSLRMLSAVAAQHNLRMRRWDFVSAYLQRELEEGETVYCSVSPGPYTRSRGRMDTQRCGA